MKIIGISGSLRAGSFNQMLLDAARELAPAGVDIVVHDIGDIMLYNADLDTENQLEPVVRFKQAIAEADALLFASPEYNASVSGVLKNAIDWASRPLRETPLMHKPAGIVGASRGMSGTVRSQAALTTVLGACGVRVMPKPNVVVRGAPNIFDEQGRITDQATRDQLELFVNALVEWTNAFKK